MTTNYLSVVSCAHCGEMIITAPDETINCACTARRSCKHPEGMGDCHECTIADLEAENARLQEHVEEAEQRATLIAVEAESCMSGAEGWAKASRQAYLLAVRERDGYKAQAERRGEALEGMGDNPDCLQCRDNNERVRDAGKG